MKKLLLFSILSVFIFSAQAQTQFGVTAGYLGVSAKVSGEGNSISATDAGFYIGAMADFKTSEKLHVQPELVYANVNDSDAIIVPIMLKYYAADKFNIQAGPQVTIGLEEAPNDFTSIGLALAAGVGYDITQNFFLEARYSFQINNYYTGTADLTARENYFTVGIGYKFM